MSDLRVYVRDRDGEERSFVVHYGMGCRLASAIDGETGDFRTLLRKAYRFDRGIYDIWSCMDCERNYRAEREFAEKHGLSYVPFRPGPCKEPVDAGIIEIDFPSRTIVSDQSGDYICHRGVRETWGYTGPHLDVGRFRRFHVPESWTIVDRYFFGRPVKIEGELDRELGRRLWEGVKWYRRVGYRVKIL